MAKARYCGKVLHGSRGRFTELHGDNLCPRLCKPEVVVVVQGKGAWYVEVYGLQLEGRERHQRFERFEPQLHLAIKRVPVVASIELFDLHLGEGPTYVTALCDRVEERTERVFWRGISRNEDFEVTQGLTTEPRKEFFNSLEVGPFRGQEREPGRLWELEGSSANQSLMLAAVVPILRT